MCKVAPVFLLITLLLSSCGAPLTPTLPTAYVVRAGTAATPAPPTPTIPPLATKPPEITPTSLPSATPVLDTPLDQYRAWMQEARAAHPYSEPIEVMWQVMLCESAGQADQVADSYYGLSQYQQGRRLEPLSRQPNSRPACTDLRYRKGLAGW